MKMLDPVSTHAEPFMESRQVSVTGTRPEHKAIGNKAEQLFYF